MRKLITVAIVILLVAAGAVGAYYYKGRKTDPKIVTAPITRGDIVQTVGATGTLEAVQTVQVGSQVSGIVKALYADFNSIVKKGQLIAKIDPQLIQTQIEQAQANFARSQADLERLKVTLADAQSKLKRAEGLAVKRLIPDSELETAQVNVRMAEAQLRSSQAALTQAQASLNQNMVNLQNTDIFAPIDGIVISRNVDQGQTVAASFNAPTLFIIAADLTRMQARASVDEADVGLMRPGQTARFRVDAYPLDEFTGTVSQVRLQAVVSQNVVTYVTVIDVPNPNLKLKPGMTANVTIEIARRENVLRIQNAALRFRPTTDIFAALNQPVPPEMQPRTGRAGAGGTRAEGTGGAGGQRQAGPVTAQGPQAVQGTQPAAGRSGASPQADPAGRPGASAQAQGQPGRPAGAQGQGAASGGQPAMDPERQQRLRERLQNMTAEERAQMMQRLRERGIDPAQVGIGGGPEGARGAGQRPSAGPSVGTQQAQTIDQLFGPLQVTQAPGRAWRHIGSELKMTRLRLGITDGTYTELLEETLKVGDEVVTSVDTGLPVAQTPTGRSPLMPTGRPGGMGGPGGPH